jgi:hypothetical protein
MFGLMSGAPRLTSSAPLSLLSLVLALSCESYSQHSGEEQTDPSTLPDPATALPAPQAGLCSIGLTCDQAIEDDPKVACRLAVTEESGISYEGIAAIERRGRSSLQYDKPNYGFELRNDDGSNRSADLMAMGSDEDWLLDGSWIDRSFVRNQLVSDLFSSFSAGRFSPRGQYCQLFLNEDYRGIYRLVERIKRGSSRIDLPADEGAGDSFVIQQDPDGPLRFDLGLEDNWDTIYPKDPSGTQRDGIQHFLDDLEDALARRSDDPVEGVFGFLDHDNVIDWIIIQELSRNVDAYKLSVHLYRGRGKAHLVPWDFDLSMGQPTIDEDAPEPDGGDQSAGWGKERTKFIEDIIAVPGVREAVAERWRQLRKGVLTTSTVMAQIDAYVHVIEGSIEKNFERWPLERVRFDHIYPPYSLYDVESHADEIATLKAWLQERLTWIDDNVDSFGSTTR